MREKLNDKQRKILDFITSELNSKGYPPAVREICKAVGLRSTSTVHSHLTKLESMGYIKRDPSKPRAIEILDEDNNNISPEYMAMPRETAYVPIVGRVTAGEPILAVENIEEMFPLPIDFVDSGSYFMLEIDGESMINAGIHDHDYVLVRQQEEAKNGEIVIALIDDSATCKTFYKEKNRVRLQPQNDFMDPIYPEYCQILGVVKGVYRKM